jgi:hypothetical protein
MHQYTGYIKVYKQWYNLFRLYTIVNLTYIREVAQKSCALQIYSNFVIIIIIGQ